MLTQFISIGFLLLFTAMLPGPDFAMVTKNTLLHSRRAGLFTSLGIASAALIHFSYCALGLAWVIKENAILFHTIKYIGASYLIYLGVTSFFSTPQPINASQRHARHTSISAGKAFRQGFLCNLLNPKATVFFLALFTVVIKPTTPPLWLLLLILEMFLIVIGWFGSLTFLLSHPPVMRGLNKGEKYISKIVGLFLIGFGVLLAFA